MNQTATAAQLRQANRNQEFQNTSMARAQCPLAHAEVAIFPVRYALDESPQKNSSQGPHPLSADWPADALPSLKTRSYTLRQLRDGWVYVWDNTAKTFHEYQVKGETLIRHLWTEHQLNQDVRNNPATTQPYLLYPRNSQLRIAFSPVQVTWRMCELMRSNAAHQTQWMREVDLPRYCTHAKISHGAAITELGTRVADILVSGEKAPAFTSTRLPTQATEAVETFKPAFEEALVRGRVPAQDTALFVALDDPLAIVDDLNMNLTGRLMEQGKFETAHQHNLQSAFAVQSLCGLNIDGLIPTPIKDPIQQQAYTDDLYTLLDASDHVEYGKDLVSGAEAPIVEMLFSPVLDTAQIAFTSKWGRLPEQKVWQAAVDEWNSKRLWREDVRFGEVRQYLSQTIRQALQLQQHVKRSVEDLILWLDQLSPNAESVYHDTCSEAQAHQLLESAHALYTALGNVEAGQQWICEQAKTPTKLFGLALFNFNPEVATLIRQVTHNFSTTGYLDDQGLENDGHTPALSLSASGDATSLATRTAEIKAVLDLDVVKRSKPYRALSNAASTSMATLIKIANSQAKDAWHGLSTLLMPAMKQQLGLVLASVQVLISTEISSATQLAFNSTYQRDFQAWLLKVATLQKRMTGDKRILSRPGAAHDQRAARISLEALEAQLKNIMLDRPNRIIAKASGSTRLSAGLTQVNHWLADLGRSEVMAQLKVAGTHQYLTRTQTWMNQNLGTALPVLLVGLNAWNVFDSANKAYNDGEFSADEWRTVGANAGYAANAIAALWVGPAWNRAGGMSVTLGADSKKLAQASYLEWLDEAKKTSHGSAQAVAANEMAAASRSLILRTMTWAVLGAVAAGLEAWQIAKDVTGATSKQESTLLWAKFGVVFGMSATASVQLIGASIGYWSGFAWVMSTPLTVILAIFGIAYLMITMAANRYKREGLRLWLYQCTWGRGSISQWTNCNGHLKQMQALLETLQRPSVLGRALYHGGGSTPRKWAGFWVQIQVPAALSGKHVTLQPAIIEKTNLCSANTPIATKNIFYEQFINGNWIDPKLLGQMPKIPNSTLNQYDYSYIESDQHRLWQVWIDIATENPTLEIEIKYPPGVLQRSDDRGYMFRLAMKWNESEADRIKNMTSGELSKIDEITLARNGTPHLKLNIPAKSVSEP